MGCDVFCRAHILSVNEAEKSAHIVFIDYGDEQDAAFDAVTIFDVIFVVGFSLKLTSITYFYSFEFRLRHFPNT